MYLVKCVECDLGPGFGRFVRFKNFAIILASFIFVSENQYLWDTHVDKESLVWLLRICVYWNRAASVFREQFKRAHSDDLLRNDYSRCKVTGIDFRIRQLLTFHILGNNGNNSHWTRDNLQQMFTTISKCLIFYIIFLRSVCHYFTVGNSPKTLSI